jgi:hypothetical protein
MVVIGTSILKRCCSETYYQIFAEDLFTRPSLRRSHSHKVAQVPRSLAPSQVSFASHETSLTNRETRSSCLFCYFQSGALHRKDGGCTPALAVLSRTLVISKTYSSLYRICLASPRQYTILHNWMFFGWLVLVVTFLVAALEALASGLIRA